MEGFSYLGILLLVFVSLFATGIHCDSNATSKDDNKGDKEVAECIVVEPLFKVNYDLSKLKSDLGHTFKENDKSQFAFNICNGNLPKCNDQTGVSACWTSGANNTEVVLGYNHTLAFENNKILAKYSGEKCTKNADKTFTLAVILECDYSNLKDPISLSQKTDCDFVIVYKTQSACQRQPARAACQHTMGQNWIADLAPLSTENRIIQSKNQDEEFFLNFCNPVIFGPDALCPPGSSVCLHNKKKNTFTNLGNFDGEFHEANNDLMYVFQTGQKCPTDEAKNVTSTIAFTCDQVDGEIEYVGFQYCTHLFTWPTKLVCSSLEPCVVRDLSGNTYDLREYSKKSHNATIGNKIYRFGVCNDAGGNCVEKSGACQEDGTITSYGITNSDLQLHETGTPFLEYRDGPSCKNSNGSEEKWYARIEFGCALSKEDEKTTVLEDTNCRLIIQYDTVASCPQKRIKCKDSLNGVEVDLSSLINDDGNYIANVSEDVKKLDKEGKNYTYILNVCRPLSAKYGLSCKGGSASCRVIMMGDKGENETSLGFPDISLTLVNTSKGPQPQLKYLRGDAVDKEQMSSLIKFNCNQKAGKGVPVLTEITEEFQHIFEWDTNVFCPKEPLTFNRDSCTIANKNIPSEFNLRIIGSNGTVLFPGAPIDLCAMIVDSVEVNYAERLAITSFSSNATCGKMNTEVRLECRDETKLSFIDMTQAYCRYTIKYESPLVCPLVGYKTEESPSTTVAPTKSPEAATTTTTTTTTTTSTDKPGKSGQEAVIAPETGGLSAFGVISIILTVCLLFVAVGFILKNPEHRMKVTSLFRRKNVSVAYSRVSNEEASLLMNSAGLSESDDELLI